MSKIYNNINKCKCNRQSPKENLKFFYNKKLPLLLKNNYKEKNRIKSNNLEKMKMKKKSYNKFDNFSTEIYSKEIATNNNDLLIKNKTVKELFKVNHKKNKDFSKAVNKQNKINSSKNGRQLRDYKYKKNINSYSKIKRNLKHSTKPNMKICKNKEINKIKDNDLKSLLKCIVNNSKNKNENNKNIVLINKQNNTKMQEYYNLYKIGNLSKNMKSISGNNILSSPRNNKNKKIFSQRNNNNTHMLQNYNEIKIQNDYSTKNNNISYPNLYKSMKVGNQTGYKIKNLNINYFNIIQPHELFSNINTSRSNSKPQKNHKNKYILLNTNNTSTNTNYVPDVKIKNILTQRNIKSYQNKIEKQNIKFKNSLYLITDYNINVKNKNKKNFNKKVSDFHLRKNNGSYTGLSHGNNKYEGISNRYINKDKKGKIFIKQKICNNKDFNSINLIELYNKKNVNLIKNCKCNCNTQISFVKIAKKGKNFKRDISTGRKTFSKKK
jgi:hypothetical protein